MTGPTRCRWCLAAWLAFAARCSPAFGQDRPPTSYGVEITVGSGHADRGFIINDRAVIQPVTWVTGRLAEFSIWGSLPLAETTDGARPQIVEMELTHAHRWGHLTITPAIRMFFYHDLLSRDRDRSIEGWVFLSYGPAPFHLFINHSFDVLTYRGAYFGEAGVESEGRVSHALTIGASLGAGWASSRFNEAYAGIPRSALDRIGAEGWLTARLNPRCYISPHVEFSTIVNREIRAALARPTFVLVKLATGVEF